MGYDTYFGTARTTGGMSGSLFGWIMDEILGGMISEMNELDDVWDVGWLDVGWDVIWGIGR